jgi:tetratricopeptide (TPR) repeat protein
VAGRAPGRIPAAALAGLLLAAATAAVFWPVAHHPFLLFDDDLYVTANPFLKGGLTAAAARWALTTFYAANWHPLTWLSHLADVSLFGFAPGPHHLVNLSWHVGATLLLLALLLRATGALWPSLAAATLFALHPLHVESVAWVAERKDVLSGFLGMLTLWCYVGYARRPGPGRYLLALGAFALGLAAKPMLVTIPVILLLLDWWPLGRLPRGAGDAGAAARGPGLARLAAEKLPFLLLAAGASLLTVLAQSQAKTPVPIAVLPPLVRAGNALVSAATYLVKAAWPSPLAVYYPHPGTSLPAAKVAGAALLLLALGAAAVRARRSRPALGFGLAWYLVTLLPVAGLVQVGVQAMADRYTYLPLIGVFVAAAWVLPGLIPGGRRRTAALALAAAVALPALAVATRSYLALWGDSRALFAHAAAVAPGNWLMHYNLGVIAAARREPEEAVRQYAEAVRLRPDYAEARNNLGQLLGATGRVGEGRQNLLAAVALKPDLAAAHFNLGLLALREGDRAGALERLRVLQALGSPYASTLGRMLGAPPGR